MSNDVCFPYFNIVIFLDQTFYGRAGFVLKKINWFRIWNKCYLTAYQVVKSSRSKQNIHNEELLCFIERSCNDCRLCQTKHPNTLIVTWQKAMQLHVVKPKTQAKKISFSMVNKWLSVLITIIFSPALRNSADMIIFRYLWENPFEVIILDASITL